MDKDPHALKTIICWIWLKKKNQCQPPNSPSHRCKWSQSWLIEEEKMPSVKALPSLVTRATIVSDTFCRTLQKMSQSMIKFLIMNLVSTSNNISWMRGHLPPLQGSNKPFEKMMLLPNFFRVVLMSYKTKSKDQNHNIAIEK